MKFVAAVFIALVLSSCISTYAPATHCTPDFSDKKQAVFAASAGISGFSANAAYTPVKYIGLAANLQNFGGTRVDKSHTYFDGALLGYIPNAACTPGFMLGYGRGSYDWESMLNLSVHRNGTYQKLYVMGYGVIHLGDISIVPSLKMGYIFDHTNSYINSDNGQQIHDTNTLLGLYEFFCNVKEEVAPWFYLTAGAGFSVEGKVDDFNSPFNLRVGLELNFNKHKPKHNEHPNEQPR